MHTYVLRDRRIPVISRDDRKRIEQSYLRYAGSGIEFFAMIAVMTLVGAWLDHQFGTSPALTMVLALLGFVGATWILVRSVFDSNDAPSRSEKKP